MSPTPLRVTVLRGGPDAEREVSLRSGDRVIDALSSLPEMTVIDRILDRPDVDSLRTMLDEDRCDVVFPVLHGPWGEGGPLQSILETIDRPFVGAGEAAARRAMDKLATKSLAIDLGIPTPDARRFETEDDLPPTPFVLKPVDDGSSVGVMLVHRPEDLPTALAELAGVRDRLMVETLIDGRELTVGIVGDVVLPSIEIVPADRHYDFEAKYHRDDTTYHVDPELPEEVADRLAHWTRTLHDALGVEDLSRTDWLLETPPGGSPRVWLLELNTMPGLTDQSLLPKAAARHGWAMPRLCGDLVRRAHARHQPSTS